MVRPRSPKTAVSRLFFASQRPIYVLDSSNRIVFSNQALSDWIAISEEQIQGTKCSYSESPDSDSSWQRRLAVPPQVQETGEYCATISSVQIDGTLSVRSAAFFSLQDTEESTLVIVDDKEYVEQVAATFDTAVLHRRVADMRKEWSENFRLDHVIGESPAMKQVRDKLQLAAGSQARIVIVGNEGSGRESIARTIHHERTLGAQMLVPLSCAILDAELLQTTIGTLVKQLAELDDQTSSVLLLLDVDRLSIDAQSALLGFLEIPEFGLQTLATSRTPLLPLAEQQKFRPELACHLTSLEICIPALSERQEDIPMLAQWMLEKTATNDQIGGFTPEAMEQLVRYGWPRETQEVREVVAEAVKNARTSTVEAADLPKRIGFAADAAVLPDVDHENVQLDSFLAGVETELIVRALGQAKGNKSQAARALGVSRGKLLRRIEQLEIEG